MLHEFDDIVQELQLFLWELVNNIDLTRFSNDSSNGLSKYIAKSLGRKFLSCKKKNQFSANDLDIMQFEFIIHESNCNTLYLQDILSKLNDKQKIVCIYKLYGFSDAEIGVLLGISRQAVHKTIINIRKRLAEELEI